MEVGTLIPIEPRGAWRSIYRDAEACTGVEGNFARVDWFRTDRIEDRAGEPSGGAWLIAEGRPHGIALASDLLENGDTRHLANVVRHESIHEIVQLGDHSDPIWCECDARPQLFPQCPESGGGGTAS